MSLWRSSAPSSSPSRGPWPRLPMLRPSPVHGHVACHVPPPPLPLEPSRGYLSTPRASSQSTTPSPSLSPSSEPLSDPITTVAAASGLHRFRHSRALLAIPPPPLQPIDPTKSPRCLARPCPPPEPLVHWRPKPLSVAGRVAPSPVLVASNGDHLWMRLPPLVIWVGRTTPAVAGIAGSRRRGVLLPRPGACPSVRRKKPGQVGPSSRGPTCR